METHMANVTRIGEFLKFIFAYFLYPILVIAIFAYIIGSLVFLIKKVKGSAVIRRTTAAILPVAMLVFLIIAESNKQESFASMLGGIEWWQRFAVGALAGLLMMELSRKVTKTDREVAASIYALFLSLVGMFILYCVMTSMLQNIHEVLLGLVLAGGLHVVLLGPPQTDTGGEKGEGKEKERESANNTKSNSHAEEASSSGSTES